MPVAVPANRPINWATGQIVTGQGTLAGFIVRETAGAAAVVRIYDNTAASGTLLASFTVAASGSIVVTDLDARYETGVFTQIVSGTIEGSIYVA